MFYGFCLLLFYQVLDPSIALVDDSSVVSDGSDVSGVAMVDQFPFSLFHFFNFFFEFYNFLVKMDVIRGLF